MEKECSHGVEFDVPCFECEMVSLDDSISYHGKSLESAKSRRVEVLQLIEEQKQLLNEACEGTM